MFLVCAGFYLNKISIFIKFNYQVLNFVLVRQHPNQLKRNNLLTTVKVLQRGWSVSFEIKPTGIVSRWANIIHATLGRDNKRYGDRNPAVWFRPNTRRLHICSAVSGNKNRCYNSASLPKNKFTRVLIRQIQKRDFKYHYQIFINGRKRLDVINRRPRIFKNVKYYATDPWYTAANAQLRSFKLKMFPHKGS